MLSHAARESRRAIRILRLYKHQLAIFAKRRQNVPDTHIRRRHHAAAGYVNQDQLDREDCALNSVREFVENHYGQLDQLFS